MKIIETGIEGLLILQPNVFEDNRGYFFESYNQSLFENAKLDYKFVQDNQSLSQKGILRGLHFQNPPYEQGKLVRVIQGAVQDIAVDIRENSPTYGKWNSTVLSASNKLMYLIPPGFAHGFLSLENNTIFFYKCTNFYNKESEGSIRWNDPNINIKWEITPPSLSAKDEDAPLFKDFVSQF